MYSYEDRIRAVELYITLGKRVRATIRQLGYPRNWQSTTIEQFIQAVDSYIRWYNERRIKISPGLSQPHRIPRESWTCGIKPVQVFIRTPPTLVTRQIDSDDGCPHLRATDAALELRKLAAAEIDSA
jgi:hypothetical protein